MCENMTHIVVFSSLTDYTTVRMWVSNVGATRCVIHYSMRVLGLSVNMSLSVSMRVTGTAILETAAANCNDDLC